MNFFKSIAAIMPYIGDIGTFVRLFGEVKAALKDKTEASIELAIEDVTPLVAKYAPNIPPDELNAIAGDLIALVTLSGDHSLKHSQAVALVIVDSLPKFGVNATQEHTDNLVKALADVLDDLEAK